MFGVPGVGKRLRLLATEVAPGVGRFLGATAGAPAMGSSRGTGAAGCSRTAGHRKRSKGGRSAGRAALQSVPWTCVVHVEFAVFDGHVSAVVGPLGWMSFGMGTGFAKEGEIG